MTNVFSYFPGLTLTYYNVGTLGGNQGWDRRLLELRASLFKLGGLSRFEIKSFGGLILIVSQEIAPINLNLDAPVLTL